MCRMAAYIGRPVPLSSLVYDPERSLYVQAYNPREMLGASVNCDGTGLAWWLDGEPEPLRYAVDRPPWQDPNLPALSRRLSSGLQVAAVRAATPGIPYGTTNVAPFVRGRYALSHNGFIGAFRQHTARRLLERLPDHLHAAMDGVSDSQVLFLTLLRHLESDPAGGLLTAVGAAMSEIAQLCADFDARARLNVIVADGERVVAARVARDAVPNSLYTLADGARWAGAGLVASEPLDDDKGWTPVADGDMVEVTADGIRSVAVAEVAGV